MEPMGRQTSAPARRARRNSPRVEKLDDLRFPTSLDVLITRPRASPQTPMPAVRSLIMQKTEQADKKVCKTNKQPAMAARP